MIPSQEVEKAAPFQYQCSISDEIHCAHQLNLPYASKCNSLHGHMYRIRVVLQTSVLNAQGMVIDFSWVKDAIRVFDHKNLNDFFQPSTAEKFAEVLLDALQSKVFKENPYVRVIEVGVGETASTWVTIRYNGK